jgi:ParB family transcriptional regulator, chromosome partitioning protein
MSMDSEPVILRRRSPGLGRGLSALLGDTAIEQRAAAEGGIRTIAIGDIAPNPEQPRRHFDDDALDELAESIAAHGVLQPIMVRAIGNRFQIVAGERRWRAAQRAQLHQIPAIVRDFDDATTLEVALLENIQRQDLNAIEEGEAYARLTRQFGHSPEALGALVHKSRSHVANLMRLLDLPAPVRALLADGQLQMGHARALLNVPDAEQLAGEAIAKGWSVRDIERAAKRAKHPAPIEYKSMNGRALGEADLLLLERNLSDLMGLRLKITQNGEAGHVTINYASLDQLDMICQRLTGTRI